MRQEKQLLLDEIKNQLDEAPAFVITSYKGLDPNLAFDFRKTVHGIGGRFYVIKKRIFLKAAAEIGLKVDSDKLPGHLAIVSSGEDTVGAAKATYGFKKSYKDILDILGGYFDGKLCSSEEVEEISKLPSKDEMRAAFVQTLEAPMSQTIAVIEAVLTSVIHCLDGKIKKEENH